MATMEETQIFENRILERLNAKLTAKGFIQASVTLLAEAVDLLILQAFRKDDYAVKYAVEPLLEGSGPLADLPVRLKLIYALGVITRDEYEDVELLLALNHELQNTEAHLSFTDDSVLGPLNMLHGIILPPTPTMNLPDDVIDDKLVDMQRQRYQQAIRSTLVLCITDLLSRLCHKKAF